MIIGSSTITKNVIGLSTLDRNKIDAYLIDLVDQWILRNGHKWFSAKDILPNKRSWVGTDILILYSRLLSRMPPPKAWNQANSDLGKILKIILSSDARLFYSRQGPLKKYHY